MYKCSRHEYHLNHLAIIYKGATMTKCPYKYKYELVDWLIRFDNRITKACANRKTKRQLYWLFYNLPSLIRKDLYKPS
jgi:hypothetical protein